MTIIVCSLIGNYFATRDLNRVKTIEEIFLMIQIISTEIKFCKTPLDSIVNKLSKNDGFIHLNFICECEKLLGKQKFPTAWQTSVKKSALHESDKQLLISLGNNLGTSDVEGQLSNCELHKELFENNYNSAREKCLKFGKLYTSLGLFGGVLVAVVIF